MIEQAESRIRVQDTVASAADDLFAVVADPRRHVEIDGSGMLQGIDESSPSPLTAVGQVFTMAMSHPALGDYRTDNHVVEFEPGRRITWSPGRAGDPPAGVWWTWEFAPMPGGATVITHIYDWSRVTDPAVLARITFPRVQPEQMQATMDRLVAAAG